MVVGDEILSRTEFDPFAPVVVSRVEKVFRLYASLWEIRLGGQLIETTDEHPLYVDGRGWTAVRDLNVGDRVLGLDEQYTPVESVHSTTRETPVFNLRVANEHTYFVGAEEWGFAVWVHNSYKVNRDTGEVFYTVNGSEKKVGTITEEDGKYFYKANDGTPDVHKFDTMDEAADHVESTFNAPRGGANGSGEGTLRFGERGTVHKKGVIQAPKDHKFLQDNYGAKFSDAGDLNGATVDEVVTRLKNGQLTPNDLLVKVVARDGTTHIINTRSFVALTRAGLKPIFDDVTGIAKHEQILTNKIDDHFGDTWSTVRPR